jgi:hypothetical protein
MPGATFVTDSEALLTETLGSETGPCGVAAVTPDMDEPCGVVPICVSLTVKPLPRLTVPPNVVTDTLRFPGMAPGVIVMLVVILVLLFTVKLFIVMPLPKLTNEALRRLVPVIITLLNVCPWVPELGLTLLKLGMGVVLSSMDMVLKLVTARSSAPSLLKSPTATLQGEFSMT